MEKNFLLKLRNVVAFFVALFLLTNAPMLKINGGLADLIFTGHGLLDILLTCLLIAVIIFQILFVGFDEEKELGRIGRNICFFIILVILACVTNASIWWFAIVAAVELIAEYPEYQKKKRKPATSNNVTISVES